MSIDKAKEQLQNLETKTDSLLVRLAQSAYTVGIIAVAVVVLLVWWVWL